MSSLLLCLALQETRVTLDLKDVSFATAARRALEPFGQVLRIRPADLSRRVSLRLRDAGYLQALEALSELAGWGPVISSRNPVLNDGAISCGSGDADRQRILTTDLTPSLRLIVVREYYSRREHMFDFLLISPPGTSIDPATFEGTISGAPFRAEGRGYSYGYGCPVLLELGGKGSYLPPEARLELAGTLALGDGRRVTVRTDSIEIPADENFPGPPPTERDRWAFLVGGLALSATLVLGSAALLRIRPVTSKPPGSSGS